MFRVFDPKPTTRKSEQQNFSVKNINSSSNIENLKAAVESSITAFYNRYPKKQNHEKRLQKRQANPSGNSPSTQTNFAAI